MTTEDSTDPLVARREKLRAIEALGIDPWGQRTDGLTQIGPARAMAGDVKYRFADGTELELPDFDNQDEDFKLPSVESGPQ